MNHVAFKLRWELSFTRMFTALHLNTETQQRICVILLDSFCRCWIGWQRQWNGFKLNVWVALTLGLVSWLLVSPVLFRPWSFGNRLHFPPLFLSNVGFDVTTVYSFNLPVTASTCLHFNPGFYLVHAQSFLSGRRDAGRCRRLLRSKQPEIRGREIQDAELVFISFLSSLHISKCFFYELLIGQSFFY